MVIGLPRMRAGAGVIVRTAAEGASEDELARDVKRLQAQWEEIQRKAAEGHAPVALSEEPDLVIRVVRDLFNEDFRELVVQGDHPAPGRQRLAASRAANLLEPSEAGGDMPHLIGKDAP